MNVFLKPFQDYFRIFLPVKGPGLQITTKSAQRARKKAKKKERLTICQPFLL